MSNFITLLFISILYLLFISIIPEKVLLKCLFKLSTKFKFNTFFSIIPYLLILFEKNLVSLS